MKTVQIFILKISLISAMAFVLSACNQSLDNQIEKCVAAVTKQQEEEEPRGSKSDIEAVVRITCLNAAAGK